MDKQRLEAFWSHAVITESDLCWYWTGHKIPSGYGTFCVNGKFNYAHRLSWEIENGEIPEGLYILHKCDNPSCVNPNHLFSGTQADNMQDMVNKGRKVSNPPKGIKHPLSKLTDDDIREIRKIYIKGKPGDKPSPYSVKGLSVKYNVASSLIHRIVKRVSWPHIK